jgi:glycosyltransferase involved in cell wall biosynthesis
VLTNNKNIKYKFLGYLNNEDIYTFYKNNNVNAFINVSSSEGIPVTIMEALSFSIPIIATNVGGVSEIVDDRNGILMSPNPATKEISDAIINLIELSDNQFEIMCQRAYETWSNDYCAAKNYRNFTDQILNL